MGRYLHGSIRIYDIRSDFSPRQPVLLLYYTPLTSLAWPIVTGMSYTTFRVLRWFTRSNSYRGASRHFEELKIGYHKMLLQGMPKTVEESALKSPPDIDTRAFLWTFDRLDEDNELERFFSGLPGYRSSAVVGHLLLSLAEEQKRKLSAALLGLADRTFSSGLLPEPVQNRRAIICAKAIDPEYIPESMDILDKPLSIYREGRPLAAEIVQIVRGWGSNDLSLALLIHVTRQQLNHLAGARFFLCSRSGFGIQYTR
ncbi:hypothetical protein EDB83DRAFT_259255 [Lactarius deliciosus]|nr:hypothetical protein EDB83DRAFT_259255 [Lactarius deliciosus]